MIRTCRRLLLRLTPLSPAAGLHGPGANLQPKGLNHEEKRTLESRAPHRGETSAEGVRQACRARRQEGGARQDEGEVSMAEVLTLSDIAREEQELKGKLKRLLPERGITVKQLDKIDFEIAAARERLSDLKQHAAWALDATLAIGSTADADEAEAGGPVTDSAPVEPPAEAPPQHAPVDVTGLISVANVA